MRAMDLRQLESAGIHVHARVSGVTGEIITGLQRWASDVRLSEDGLSFLASGEDAFPEIHRFLVEKGAAVYSFQPEKTSLEEIFLQMIGEDTGQ